MCSVSDDLHHGSKLGHSRQKAFFSLSYSLVAGKYTYWPQSGLIFLAVSHQEYQLRRKSGMMGLLATRREWRIVEDAVTITGAGTR